MTGKQVFLKWLYPFTMQMGKWLSEKKNIQINAHFIKPTTSFYDLQAVNNAGTVVHFSEWEAKKVLIVNTASFCGFTAQYAELQKLYDLYPSKLIILAFPSNDFKEQEPDTNAQIAQFCSLNYGVQFLLMQKSVVVKSEMQHPVFQWLSNADKNGWNNQAPVWNFNKYLVNESGILTHYFSSFISPLSPQMKAAIEQ
ncbi:MAG: glutathione peroxidase [Bacteroidota bacterium]|jgi:glutathione peroxidase|nr:glutathione peroxidase [Bacteroidota bacterium]